MHLSQGGLKFGNGRGQRIDLRLQPFTVDTRDTGLGSHAALFYAFPDQWHYPVNRYGFADKMGAHYSTFS